MSYRSRNVIEDLKVKIKRLRDGVPLEDCLGLYIFSLLRTHIASDQLMDKFPYIKFYADWMLHPKLDFNKTGKVVVKNLTEVVRDTKIPVNLKTQEINRKLGHTVLHKELKDFFSEYKIDDMFLEDKVWKNTFGTLARLVTSKPINLKGDKSAHFKASEISGVEYESYPVFWLYAEPGEGVKSYIACVSINMEFTEDLILNHSTNGTIIFEAGLYWDAL